MNFGELTKEEKQGITKFCEEIICNSHYCRHCGLLRQDNICFFGIDCIENDFKHYMMEQKGKRNND
jgi:hypothetical protein